MSRRRHLHSSDHRSCSDTGKPALVTRLSIISASKGSVLTNTSIYTVLTIAPSLFSLSTSLSFPSIWWRGNFLSPRRKALDLIFLFFLFAEVLSWFPRLTFWSRETSSFSFLIKTSLERRFCPNTELNDSAQYYMYGGPRKLQITLRL